MPKFPYIAIPYKGVAIKFLRETEMQQQGMTSKCKVIAIANPKDGTGYGKQVIMKSWVHTLSDSFYFA